MLFSWALDDLLFLDLNFVDMGIRVGLRTHSELWIPPDSIIGNKMRGTIFNCSRGIFSSIWFWFMLLVKFALVLIQEGFRSVGLLSALNCLAKLGVKEWGAMLRSTTDSVSTSDSFSVSHMHLDFMLTVFRKWSDKFSLILLGLLQFF